MELVAVTFVIGLISSTVSGMGGIGTAFGAAAAFKGKGLVHKKLVVPFMAITFVCSLSRGWLWGRMGWRHWWDAL